MSHSPADRFRRLATRFDAVIATLTPAELAAATPCTDWTVADVLRHVADSEHDFLVQRGLADAAPEGDAPPVTDPVVHVRTAIAAMQAALDDPATAATTYDGWFGPTTVAQSIDGFYALDLLVHAWDVAAAVGRSDLAQPDEQDIVIARELLAPVGDAIRMPGVCGPEVPAPSGAAEFHRFLAWTGRDPAWTPQ